VHGGRELFSEKGLNELVDNIRKMAESKGSNELTLAYATELSLAVNQIFSDKKIEEIAINSDPLDFVGKFFVTFTEEFDRQVQAEQDRVHKEQQEYIQTKAKSINNLYIAAASFGIFIIVVFLSIFIKIERNLRCLEVRNHADTSTT
jgi:predicted RNase H-like nuclease (RuvC/YqgF family)